jgi:TP901 family phage tail tape measure protein
MSKTAVGVGIVLGASVGASVGSTFATVDSRIKGLRGNVKGLQTVATSAAALTTAEARLKAAQQANAVPTETTRRALVDAERAYLSAERTAKKYNVTVGSAAKAHADATAAIKQQETALARLDKHKANQATRKEIHGQVMGTVASAVAAGAPVKLAMDFETSMAKVRGSTQFTAQGFEDFKRQAMSLPGVYGGSISEMATIAAAGGIARIAEEELVQFTAVGQQMVRTWNMSAEEAGDVLAGLRTRWSLSQDEANSMLDAVNHLANNMHKGSGADILEFTHKTAEMADSFGVNREQVAAMGATWAALRVPAKQGITATRELFNTLGGATSAGKDAQAAFGRLFEGGAAAVERNFKEDANRTMMMVLEKIGRQSKQEQLRLVTDIFGSGQAENMLGLIRNLDKYEKALGLVADQTNYAGSFQSDFDTAMDTTAVSLELLKNKAVELGTALGTGTLPAMRWAATAGWQVLDMAVFLVNTFPTVTSVVMGAAAGLVALKIAALGGRYAGTLLSDGWLIAKATFNFFRPSVMAANAALLKNRAIALGSAVAMKTKAAATWVATGGIGKMAAAQWLLNSALLANPIVWVVGLVAALGVGLYMLYQRSETARNIMGTMFQPFVAAWNVVEAVWTPVGAFFSGMWDGIVDSARAPFDWIAGKFAWVTESWGKVSGIFSSVGGFFGKGKENTPVEPMQAIAPSLPAAAPAGITASPVSAGKAASVRPGAAPAAGGAVGASGSVTLSPQIAFNVNFGAVPSQDVGDILVKAIKAKEREVTEYFEGLLKEIASDQLRLAYG